jgi:PhnB protein
MLVQPYLFFEGRCEEAIEFYKSALGAKVQMLTRYNQSPYGPPALPPGSENKVMHASLVVGESMIFCSDGHCKGSPNFSGFRLTITADNDAGADRLFAAITAAGKVEMPLSKTFFSSRFGMATDQFGVGWMVMVREG